MRTEDIEPVELGRQGSYVLFLCLPEPVTVPVGKLGTFSFHQGYYTYAGSALSGLKNRLLRHLRTEKKLHWHIDYLLRYASITDILVVESGQRLECIMADRIGREYGVIRNFGSSDCTCPGHLFHSRNVMTDRVVSLVREAGLAPRLLHGNERKKNDD